MTQEVRNKVYALAGTVVAILTIVGVVDKVQGDEALTLTNGILDLIGQALALFGLIVAFVKSLTSRTTTIDIPKAEVAEVITPDGVVLAGPQSSLADGQDTGKRVAPPTS